jgi:hypothetical protein
MAYELGCCRRRFGTTAQWERVPGRARYELYIPVGRLVGWVMTTYTRLAGGLRYHTPVPVCG